MILTTSKRPSGRTRTFARELVSVFPDIRYVQRGKKSVDVMAEEACYGGHERLCIIKTKDGNPAGFEFMDTETKEYIGGMDFTVTLRREMKKERIPPPQEYSTFLMVSDEEDASLLCRLFSVHLDRDAGDAMWFATFREGRMDFFRHDVDENPVGPRLFVRSIYGKDHHHH